MAPFTCPELPVPYARLLDRLQTLPARDHLAAAARMRAADRQAWTAARRLCLTAHLARCPHAARQELDRALMELAESVWSVAQHHVAYAELLEAPPAREAAPLWSLYCAAVYAVSAHGCVPDDAVRTLYAPFAECIPLEEVVS